MSIGNGGDDDRDIERRLNNIERMLRSVVDLFNNMVQVDQDERESEDFQSADLYKEGDTSILARSIEEYVEERVKAATDRFTSLPAISMKDLPEEDIETVADALVPSEPDKTVDDMYNVDKIERYHFYTYTYILGLDHLDSVYSHLSRDDFAKFIKESFISSAYVEPEHADLIRNTSLDSMFFGVGVSSSDDVNVSVRRLRFAVTEAYGTYWWTSTPANIAGPISSTVDEFTDLFGMYFSPLGSVEGWIDRPDDATVLYGDKATIETVKSVGKRAEEQDVLGRLYDDNILELQEQDIL